MIDLVPSSVDPTLYLQSEEQVLHPTLPLKSEFKVVKSMSVPLDPTLSLESVKTEVVTLTQSLSHLPIERELKPNEVFVVTLSCSRQGEILFVST